MAVVGAVIAGVGIASSLIGARKAEKAAKRQAREEARLEGIVTTEKLRQMRVEEEAVVGSSTAAAAASGVDVNMGSVADIVSEIRENARIEQNAVRRAGASRAANALARGSMVSDQARFQGISNALQFASSVNWGAFRNP